jgi:hypothetical protein
MPTGRGLHVNCKLDLPARRGRPFGNQLRFDSAGVAECRDGDERKQKEKAADQSPDLWAIDWRTSISLVEIH